MHAVYDQLLTGVRAGKYYVEESSGSIAYLEDPAINGRISQRDDGTEVRLKFNAPKVQVVYLLISGVLESKLNWGLVLIGVALAVAMELCGVSSLAFAVGVYLPMAATTPIFLGGLVRYFVDRANVPKATTSARDEASAIAESETGSGVLLASGYIAGGSLAGVLLAFSQLNESVPPAMSAWQYSQYTVTEAADPRLVYESLSREYLHLPKDDKDLVPEGKTNEEFLKQDAATLTPDQLAKRNQLVDRDREINPVFKQIKEINQRVLPLYVIVPAGREIELSAQDTLKDEKESTLADVIQKERIPDDQVRRLLLLNSGKLKLPEEKPADAKLHLEKPDADFLKAVHVPAGTELTLPRKKTFAPKDDMRLDDLAKEKEGHASAAAALFNANEKRLELPSRLPKGAVLNLPQHAWPALVSFGVLTFLLGLVGLGFLLKIPDETPAAATPQKTTSDRSTGQPDRSFGNRPNDKFKDKRRDEDDDA